MSKQPKYTSTSGEVGDAFAGFLDTVARMLFWAGIVLTLVCTIILVHQFQAAAGNVSGFNEAQAVANIELFGKLLIAAVVAVFVGSTYMFWGEDILPAIQIIGSLLLYFGPPFLPQAFGGVTPGRVGPMALGAIQSGGLIFGILALCSLSADLYVRARERVRQGAKADALKYGKGLKQEREIQNVFMGNCWQLPFCRKFVRERCPIFHSKRTCWKEQTGCMCEEKVIQNAMENKPIPKDAVAAAALIPHNNKLTSAQKFERCKSCVIYNEHQKHKYKLALPITLAVFVGFWFLIRSQAMHLVKGLIDGLDRMVGRVTFNSGSGGVSETISQSSVPFHEIVLVCLLLIGLAYALKLVEFLIFKAKI